MLAVQADGRATLTVEGRAGADGRLGLLSRHSSTTAACSAGSPRRAMVITAPVPRNINRKLHGTAAIREAISGVLCRCTGYQHIVESIHAAAGGGAA